MLRLLLFAASIMAACAGADVGPPIGNAHAHNDYEHARPLLDALSHGFTSVEADVYLVHGKLLVAHEKKDVDPAKTLERLYLDPLKKLAGVKKSIFDRGDTLTLLIDLKTDADSTYEALKNILSNYQSMLTVFSDSSVQTNAVTIILSGNRPRDRLLEEKRRFAAFDGRLSDLGTNHSLSFMPLVSDNWSSHFTWKGEGEFPAAERTRLRKVVGQAHAESRRIRFWATPDKKAIWRELHDANVDLINTDDLAGLAAFLRAGK